MNGSNNYEKEKKAKEQIIKLLRNLAIAYIKTLIIVSIISLTLLAILNTNNI